MEDANRIAATANTGNYSIRQAFWPILTLTHLIKRLTPNHALEVAHHRWVGMGAKGAAEQIVRCVNIGDPIADGFVNSVLECFATAFYSAHISSQQLHTKDIGLLAGHIHGTHVDNALNAQQGGYSSGSDAVLARAGFRHDA